MVFVILVKEIWSLSIVIRYVDLDLWLTLPRIVHILKSNNVKLPLGICLQVNFICSSKVKTTAIYFTNAMIEVLYQKTHTKYKINMPSYHLPIPYFQIVQRVFSIWKLRYNVLLAIYSIPEWQLGEEGHVKKTASIEYVWYWRTVKTLIALQVMHAYSSSLAKIWITFLSQECW